MEQILIWTFLGINLSLTVLTILYILKNIWKRYSNPQLFIHKKLDEKEHKANSEKFSAMDKIEKQNGVINSANFKASLTEWKRNVATKWTNSNPYPRPRKKDFKNRPRK